MAGQKVKVKAIPRPGQLRISCRVKKVVSDAEVEWKGVINEKIRSKFIDLEARCEDCSWEERRHARRIRAALLRGICPEVPPIKAVAHKYRSFPRGIHVSIVPDTGTTMMLIQWSMVKQLDLTMDKSDNQYDLYTANGEPMTVLGSVVLCIEPEVSNTKEVYALVTSQLGEEEILLSYSDMRDWDC